MAKVSQPLFSFRAKGRFAQSIDFQDHPSGYDRQGRVIVQGFKKKPCKHSQYYKRQYMIKIAALWRDLTPEEKASWEHHAADYTKYGAEFVWRPEFANYHKFMQFNLKRLHRGITPSRSAPGAPS